MPPNPEYTKKRILSTKYGMLQPIELVADGIGDKRVWRCRCDCGQEVNRNERTFTRTTSRAMNCGCQSKRLRAGEESPFFTGCGKVSGSIISKIKIHAAKRKIEFAVTAEQLWEQFLKQDGKCALTGVPLTFAPNSNTRLRSKTQNASLDRIDSSRGYFPDNIHWTEKTLQRMKWGIPNNDFIEWCRTITKYQQEKTHAR